MQKVIVVSAVPFPARVALLVIPNALRNFTQPVTAADDRCDLSGVHEFSQGSQVLPGYFRPIMASFWPAKRDNTDAFIKRASSPIIQRPPPSAAPTMM